MTRKVFSVLLCVALSGVPQLLWAQVADPEVQKGITQVDNGDFDAAILTLDAAARRLAADPSKAKDLSQAYVYLGIAYVGKGHEAAAKAKFREALDQIKDLSLSPDKFPPKVIDIFEAAKEEARTAPAAPPQKKGGSSKGLLIGLGVVAVGGGIAAAAGGGGKSSTTTTLPVDTRRVETFTGTVCPNDSSCNYRQFDIVVTTPGLLEATVTWTDGSVFFALELDDENYQTVSRSNRVTNTSSQLSAQVTPRTSSPGAAYRLFCYINEATKDESFTLTVKHP